MNFKTASEEYLREIEVYQAHGTWDYNDRKIKKLSKYIDPDTQIENIDRKFILEYIRAVKKDKPKLSNTTINREVGVLKKIIQHHTGLRIQTRKLPETKKQVRDLDDRDIKKVFNYLEQKQRFYPEFTRNYVLFRLILDTGLRISETLNLKVNDFDFPSNTIHVKITKTNNERFVFFSDSTKRLIQKMITTHKLSTYLFWSYKKNRPLTVSNVQSFCYRLENRLNLPAPIRPHRWRHTFANKFMKKGGDLETLRLILGHSSIKTTQIYLHFDRDYLREQYFQINKDERW